MSIFGSIADAIKSFATGKVYIKEDVILESRKCANYAGLVYCNYMKTAGIRFSVDKNLSHDVQDGVHGYSFVEAVAKETAAAVKVNEATTFLMGVPWVLARLEKSLQEVANPQKVYSHGQSVEDANDWTATLMGLLDPNTGLLKGSKWDNALAHGKLHSLIYSDDQFEASLLNCRPSLIHFVVVYESMIRALDQNIP